MDIFFQDSDEIPLPPEEVRIRSLKAETYPDGQRMRITVETDPAQKPPNLEITLTDAAGDEISQTSIIESMTRNMEFTLHIRKPEARPPFTITATLFFTAPLSPEAAQLPERFVTDQVSRSVEL